LGEKGVASLVIGKIAAEKGGAGKSGAEKEKGQGGVQMVRGKGNMQGKKNKNNAKGWKRNGKIAKQKGVRGKKKKGRKRRYQ